MSRKIKSGRVGSLRRANRRFYTFITIVFLICSLYFIYTFFEQSYMMSSLNEEIEKKRTKVEELNKEIVGLSSELERVDDLDFIEDVARNKLKMVKPGEIIYVDDGEKSAE